MFPLEAEAPAQNSEPSPGSRFDPQIAAVRAQNFARDVQAEAGAGHAIPYRAAAVKLVEDALALALRDAGAAIVHANNHAIAFEIGHNADGRSGRRIFQGIIDQLAQGEREQFRIGRNARQVRARIQAHRSAGRLRFEMLENFREQLRRRRSDSRSRRIFPASICDMRTASVTS